MLASGDGASVTTDPKFECSDPTVARTRWKLWQKIPLRWRFWADNGPEVAVGWQQWSLSELPGLEDPTGTTGNKIKTHFILSVRPLQ